MLNSVKENKIMTEKYDVGKFGPIQAFKVKEGNLTMTTTQGVGGDIVRPSLASPIVEGDPVKIAGDLLFVKCSAGDIPIAYAHANPNDWEVEPTANANDGDYPRRYCALEFVGRKIKTVKLEAANSAVTAGNYIKVGATTVGCYDKNANATNAVGIALEGASASSGAEIAVLFI